MKKKHTPFASDEDGKDLYVKAKYSGIHFLVILADGVSLTFFGKEKTPFLKVKDAIEWHVKELRQSRGQSGDQKVIDALQGALDKFEKGQVQEA